LLPIHSAANAYLGYWRPVLNLWELRLAH